MAFTAVLGINNFSPETMIVGQEYELTATVIPSGATNQVIDWFVSPSGSATLRTTGAGLGKKTYCTPLEAGNFTVKAVIKNGKLEA